jgi:adenylate kinase
VKHISTGDLLRSEKESGSELGLKAAEYSAKGMLVPDEIMIPLVAKALESPEVASKGWMLDGYPRTEAQAKAMVDRGLVPDYFVLINVPENKLVERVTGRCLDPKTGIIYHKVFNPPPAGVEVTTRADDNEETAKTRIATYNKNLEAVRNAFGSKLVIVNGDQHKTKVFDQLMSSL